MSEKTPEEKDKEYKKLYQTQNERRKKEFASLGNSKVKYIEKVRSALENKIAHVDKLIDELSAQRDKLSGQEQQLSSWIKYEDIEKFEDSYFGEEEEISLE